MGICAETVKLLVNYIFKNLNIRYVDLGVISENKAAIKCYLKAGFRINTIEQKTIQYDGNFFDKIIMSKEK